MAETVGVLGQSPELVATLQDPANLRMVADLLQHAAQQARMLRDPAAKAT